jgi:hypothetical protein
VGLRAGGWIFDLMIGPSSVDASLTARAFATCTSVVSAACVAGALRVLIGAATGVGRNIG